MGGCRTGPSPKQASIRDFLARKSPKANEARRSETNKGNKIAQGATIGPLKGDPDHPVDPRLPSKATGPEIEESGRLRDNKRRESRAKKVLERWPHSQAQSPRGQAKGPLKRLNTKGS